MTSNARIARLYRASHSRRAPIPLASTLMIVATTRTPTGTSRARSRSTPDRRARLPRLHPAYITTALPSGMGAPLFLSALPLMDDTHVLALSHWHMRHPRQAGIILGIHAGEPT